MDLIDVSIIIIKTNYYPVTQRLINYTINRMLEIE